MNVEEEFHEAQAGNEGEASVKETDTITELRDLLNKHPDLTDEELAKLIIKKKLPKPWCKARAEFVGPTLNIFKQAVAE